MPSLRHCSVGRREGPSIAQRGYLGIHAEVPTEQYLRSAIVVNGAPQIKVKSEAAWFSQVNPILMWGRACSRRRRHIQR